MNDKSQTQLAIDIIRSVTDIFWEPDGGNWVARMRTVLQSIDPEKHQLIECIAMLRTTFQFRYLFAKEWNSLLTRSKQKYPLAIKTFRGLELIEQQPTDITED